MIELMAVLADRASYPDDQAGRLTARIFIEAWHLGHLKAGRGRGEQA